MNIFFIAPEVEPFAKTGGLADVAAALAKALAALGHDVRIAMPLYRQVSRDRFGLRRTRNTVAVAMGARTLEGIVWEATLPAPTTARSKSRVPVYLIECAPLFDRDGLYQTQGSDHPDNLERFSFFSQAALRMLPALNWRPDVVHCHDWQSALACAHLTRGPMAHEPLFSSMGTVLTVHNLAYQMHDPNWERPTAAHNNTVVDIAYNPRWLPNLTLAFFS
ncbi:MAG: glycogen/starch synthase, partial [Candidatus Omnitrophica bacterium]|nr:glycogen/starch synthase [Candidatus Omnitrophota bacterium]